MIQCKDCEFCQIDADGSFQMKCHPFQNIKEPECLQKWQLLKTDMMVRAYLSTAAQYRKLAPLQEKMMKAMEREIEDMEEGEQWKYSDDDEDDVEEDDGDDRNDGLGLLN
jgi:hypothetical protein